MKLLKLILITIIFFQATFIAPGKDCKTQLNNRTIKNDTVKHKKQVKGTPNLAEIQKQGKAYKKSDDDCVFSDKYSVMQRLKHYPFSKAVKILAVSYHDIMDNTTVVNDTIFKAGLHIKNKILNYSSLIEVKTLNSKQINKLTNIIYNTSYRNPGFNLVDHAACFDPRNALVFYDKNGKVFDYIEICFECLGAESLSDKITIGTVCNQKYALLKKLFINVGLKYGTINGVRK